MNDEAPKSAYELAMERLRKKDADEGVTRQPVTDAQRAAVAEIRSLYDSKMAEIEVLHQGRLRRMMDPAELDAAEQEYRRDRERLAAERDARIEKARRS